MGNPSTKFLLQKLLFQQTTKILVKNFKAVWYMLVIDCTLWQMKINSLSMILRCEAVTILSAVGGNPSLMCYIPLMSLGNLLKEKNHQLISCTAITPSVVRCVALPPEEPQIPKNSIVKY